MKLLYDRIDPQLVRQYPTVVFTGPIYEVVTDDGIDKAVAILNRHRQIGLDTETRPVFRKGMKRKVSLLQLATSEECFLFHLKELGLPQQITDLLEREDICKIGLALNDDIMALTSRRRFTPRAFVDLQHCVRDLGIEDQSLQKLYANLFHQRISKTQQLSNWEAMPLNEKQRRYAATDAWACLKLYDEYCRLLRSGDYKTQHNELSDNSPQKGT